MSGLISQSIEILNNIIEEGINLPPHQCFQLGQVVANLKAAKMLGNQFIDVIERAKEELEK